MGLCIHICAFEAAGEALEAKAQLTSSILTQTFGCSVLGLCRGTAASWLIFGPHCFPFGELISCACPNADFADFLNVGHGFQIVSRSDSLPDYRLQSSFGTGVDQHEYVAATGLM